MKKSKKIIAILITIVIVIVGIILIFRNISQNKEMKKNEYDNSYGENKVIEKYVKELEDGTKVNISNKLNEVKTLEGLEIFNIELTYKKGMSVVLADVKNTTNKDIRLTPINLKLYDEEGNVLEILDGIIPEVKAGEKTQLNIGISSDIVNSYNFVIEKK